MGFNKKVKSTAYFKRFQVKFRRRREGKTDYYARRRLISQDKTKHNTPKYRFVVRFTLRDVICQVVAPKIKGDHVLCASYSHELPNYGLKVGLTNYAAAYCTGLLCARRLLQKLHLDKKFHGAEAVDGNYFLEETPQTGAKPFKAYLDVGLARTTTGARVFGALKGACDGGLVIPHSEEGKRFPGWSQKDEKYDPKAHKEKIFGKPVQDYMKYLKKNNEKKYEAHFSNFLKNGITTETDFVKLYTEVHKKIRDSPAPIKKKKEFDIKTAKSFAKKRLTLQERRNNVKVKKERILSEIHKKREEEGLIVAEQEIGSVKLKKKDRVKQLSTKKPKAPKEKGAGGAKGGKTDAKAGGKTDAKGGKTDAKAGTGAKTDAKAGGGKTEAKTDAKATAGKTDAKAGAKK